MRASWLAQETGKANQLAMAVGWERGRQEPESLLARVTPQVKVTLQVLETPQVMARLRVMALASLPVTAMALLVTARGLVEEVVGEGPARRPAGSGPHTAGTRTSGNLPSHRSSTEWRRHHGRPLVLCSDPGMCLAR